MFFNNLVGLTLPHRCVLQLPSNIVIKASVCLGFYQPSLAAGDNLEFVSLAGIMYESGLLDVPFRPTFAMVDQGKVTVRDKSAPHTN